MLASHMRDKNTSLRRQLIFIGMRVARSRNESRRKRRTCGDISPRGVCGRAYLNLILSLNKQRHAHIFCMQLMLLMQSEKYNSFSALKSIIKFSFKTAYCQTQTHTKKPSI